MPFVLFPDEPVTFPGWVSGRTRPPTTRELRVAAPTEVSASVDFPGLFKVRWRDILRDDDHDWNSLLNRWRVVICSKALAGNASAGERFGDRVVNLGHVIDEELSRGEGAMFEYTHIDLHLADTWVVVVGVSSSGLVGFPSTPILLRLEGPATALAYNIPSATLTWLAKTVNGYDVFALFPAYQSPFDMSNFFGMQLYAVNYFGGALTEELGNMNIFTNGTGGAYTSPWEMHLPQPILSTGSAVFTNGSVTATWSSGTVFDVTMVGRPIFIKNFLTGDGTWITGSVNVFTDLHTIDLAVAFTGATGTYTWFVPNAVNFYFVSVNRSGNRSATPLVGSPTVAL